MGYWTKVYVDDDGTITFVDDMLKNTKTNKTSNKLDCMVDDFSVIDIETTGFSNKTDDIIEIACLKVRSNKVIDELNILIKPLNFISKKITNITGITNDMVSNGVDIKEALKALLEFLEGDVIIGHNVNFDISFLRNKIDLYLDCDFITDYIDTLYLSREKFSNLSSYKLGFLCEVLKLNNKSSHRAIDDCYATLELYNLCREKISSVEYKCQNNLILNQCKNNKKDNLKGKHFCFTGTMINMSREEAINKCISLGASSDKSVTSKTTYLVMGVQDYAVFADGKESSKTKKAKKYMEEGQDIQIITEDDFIKMII